MEEKQRASGRGFKMVEMLKTRSPGLEVPIEDSASQSVPKEEHTISELSGPSGVDPGKSPNPRSFGRGNILAQLKSQEKPPQLASVLKASESSNPKVSGASRGRFLSQLVKQIKEKGDTESRHSVNLSCELSKKSVSSIGSDSSVTSLGITSVSKEFEKFSLENEQPPCIRRGEAGKKVQVYSNYVTLTTDPDKGIFEYDVRFEPEIDFAAFRYKLINQHFQAKKGIRCYDGGFKLFMPEKLTEDKLTISAKHPNDESQVIITLTFKRKMRPRESSQLYNVLFHNCAKVLDMTRLGRQNYNYRLSHPIPQYKLEIWPGYVTSVEEFEGGIHLCCDIRHRVLRTETAYDVLTNIANYDLSRFRNLATKEFLGQCVLTRYNNNLYRIDDIDWNKTPKSTFKLSSGQEISFLDYYKKQYNIDIKDINQPLLVNKPKPNKKGESPSLICLVPELCHMTGLTDKMRKDMKVMKEISAYTRVTPNQRHLGLKKFLENIRSNTRAQEILKDWGLNISDEPAKLEARVLPSEDIFFKNKLQISSPPNLEWSKYIRNHGVLRSVDIKNWLLVYNRKDSKLANSFKSMLQKVGPGLGIEINDPVMVPLADDRIESYIECLKVKVTPKTQIILCLCSTPRDDRYSAIKKFCCRERPVLSQVVNCGTIARENRMRSVVQNIALQMNNKLGGASWALHIPLRNCMICGIDSYHDAGKLGNSVGAFVASLDAEFTQWFSRTCIQEPRQELLDGLVHCFISALKKYLSVNNILPDRIVIFRDGVSDGQLLLVQKHEVQQFLDACQLVSKEYQPRFSFVVVQKRINTKFYQELDPCSDNLENPKPGSVVDHNITRRNFYDFFLVSQHVSSGTATPSHYIVLYDSSELKPDHMQRLTYKFCHMYYNWPGTIRVPAPCQYAHKLAYLVGQNIKGLPNVYLEDKLYYL